METGGGGVSWFGTPVGGYITPYEAPPTDDPSYRYVLCSAGASGPGGYNEGVLINETVTGSGALIIANADISLVGSPMDGANIPLINTDGRFVGAGLSEALENDSFQGHTFGDPLGLGSHLAFNINRVGSDAASGAGQAAANVNNPAFARMEIKPDLTNGAPKVADRTQPRAHRLPHYRRIL